MTGLRPWSEKLWNLTANLPSWENERERERGGEIFRLIAFRFLPTRSVSSSTYLYSYSWETRSYKNWSFEVLEAVSSHSLFQLVPIREEREVTCGQTKAKCGLLSKRHSDTHFAGILPKLCYVALHSTMQHSDRNAQMQCAYACDKVDKCLSK